MLIQEFCASSGNSRKWGCSQCLQLPVLLLAGCSCCDCCGFTEAQRASASASSAAACACLKTPQNCGPNCSTLYLWSLQLAWCFAIPSLTIVIILHGRGSREHLVEAAVAFKTQDGRSRKMWSHSAVNQKCPNCPIPTTPNALTNHGQATDRMHRGRRASQTIFNHLQLEIWIY